MQNQIILINTNKTSAGITSKLAKQQNRCIRMIAGTYKATSTSTVEAEVFIPPLDLYLDSVISQAIQRMEESGMARQIESACTVIRRKLRRRGQNRHIALSTVVHPKPLLADWAKRWTTPIKQTSNSRQSSATGGKRELLLRWRERWAARKPPWGEIFTAENDKGALRLHRGLSKARSSIAIQLRSGKTGLAVFLHRRRVPGYSSPICPCGNGSRIPKHIMVHCPEHREARHGLEINRRVDLKRLMTTPEGIHRATGWWLRQNILPQFQLVRELENS